MSPNNDSPDREQHVADLLRAAAQAERAPHALHARIAEMREHSGAHARARRRRRPSLIFARVAMPATAAVAAVLVLALGGGAGAPSIAQAAALGTLRPAAPAPGPDPSAPSKLLTAKVGTLHFPNWSSAGGWRSIGQRHDHVGNRTATTVYYATGSTRIAYSIVSSPALTGPKSSGDPYSTIWRRGRITVVWREGGHTCLLSGTGISAARLWRLASTK